MWSWDITKLRGPARGISYDLYVILDIFSRYTVGWTVAATESAEIAEQLIADAGHRSWPAGQPARRPGHLDDVEAGGAAAGRPRRRPVPLPTPRVQRQPLLRGGVQDVEYAPVFPDRFGSLADARAFCEEFFAYYNHKHRHSGIGWHTPASVHHRTADQIQARRAATLDAAYAANPDRFSRPPQPPSLAHRSLDQPAQPGGAHSYRPAEPQLSQPA